MMTSETTDEPTPRCPKCNGRTTWKNRDMGEAVCATHGLYLVAGGLNRWYLIGPLPAESAYWESVG
jgi:hypothetical protein